MSDRVRVLGRLSAYILFWGWNALFFAVLWLGLGPVLLIELFIAVGLGVVPAPFAAYALLLLALPLAGMGVAARWMLFDPGRLLSLFYGVQLPLMVLCLVRLFAIQQLTWATGLALATFGLGAVGLLRTLIAGFEERRASGQVVRLGLQSAYLVAGLWSALLMGIYAVGLGGVMAQGLLEMLSDLIFGRWSSLPPPDAWVILVPIFTFWGLSMLVLVVSPFALLGIALRAWQVVYEATRRRLGARWATATTAVVVGGLLAAFAVTAVQPQHRAFDTLDAVRTDADRRAALADTAAIRRGLIASYLSSERWFEGDPTGEHVAELWSESVPDGIAWAPQQLWATLMAPFVYHPVDPEGSWREKPRAEAHYGAFLDVPLRRAERDTLVRAARQTWRWQDAEAGLLDIGERRVHLDRQQIEVEPHGDWARVTVHDVYRNRTWDQQEVHVAFSLPESAAVTGLWLGPVDDRSLADRHVVAPRGAAQEVYTGEVRRRVDPALLEQVGPRQYRLRAFPIEPRTGPTSVRSIGREGPEMHLWLEVVVPRIGDGADARWPMPRHSEVRNLFWDRATTRTVAGKGARPLDAWLPESVAAPDAVRRSHTAVVGGLMVRADPVGPTRGPAPDRIRVLVDSTRSMADHVDQIEAALRVLSSASAVTLACTREATVVACPDFEASTALFWGARPLEAQIEDWRRLGGDAEAWVVITDQGSYELAALAGQVPSLDAWPASSPLWLLHVDGVLPAATPDPTLDAVFRSGGGVATRADALLDRLADRTVIDGFRFSVAVTEEADTEGAFTQIAARRAIAALDRDAVPGTLDHLDHMHQIATAHDVVTPYSSMLVLVNDRQRQALANAEARDDRFDREVETGSPATPVVSSVPEPSTWLLLAAGCGLVGWGRRRASPA